MRFTRRAMLMHLALGPSFLIHTQGHARDDAAIMDFRDPEFAQQMRIVNDDVMGGRSNSRFAIDPEGVLFEGTVSLENNGGFASVRCPVRFQHKTSGLQLTTRGDGKQYQLIIRTEASTTAPIYKSNFVSSKDWKTHQFKPEDFEAAFRGRPVDAKPLVFSEALEFGLLIADKQAGQFRLQLRQLQTI
jgi:NADH dehydrogenase [ubiquinone] 1 alpha subcomplex assembly factor 1